MRGAVRWRCTRVTLLREVRRIRRRCVIVLRRSSLLNSRIGNRLLVIVIHVPSDRATVHGLGLNGRRGRLDWPRGCTLCWAIAESDVLGIRHLLLMRRSGTRCRWLRLGSTSARLATAADTFCVDNWYETGGYH